MKTHGNICRPNSVWRSNRSSGFRAIGRDYRVTCNYHGEKLGLGGKEVVEERGVEEMESHIEIFKRNRWR